MILDNQIGRRIAKIIASEISASELFTEKNPVSDDISQHSIGQSVSKSVD